MRYDLISEVQSLEARERGVSKDFNIWTVSIAIILAMFGIWALDGAVGDDPPPSDPYNICNEPNAQPNC